MLRYIYGRDLGRFPKLSKSMFQDRAAQFADRLGWQVTVDAKGEERDEYDALDPLYVIWEQPDGRHGGSMRFLPTLGRTMIAEHFSHLTAGISISSPLIWECTRFCLAPKASKGASAALVLGAGELMEAFHLSHFIGVFDGRMQKIYRRLGVRPDVIGHEGEGREMLGVGLWEMKADAWEPTLNALNLTRETSRQWFEASMARRPEKPALLA